MALTYTYTGDFTSQKDRVRVEIGDTEFSLTSTLLLADQEIAYAATVDGSDLSVAARCCEFLAGKFAKKADMTEGKLSIKLSQRAAAYRQKAADLRALAAMSGAVPSIGGISVTDKETANNDTDRIPPAFYRGMLDNPEATQPSPGSEGESDPFNQSS